MPRIEFTLTFEEYLEANRSSQAKTKSLRLPTTFAILGFLGIAAGYVLLKMQIGSFFPGGVFLMSGLALAALSMLLGIIEKPKRQQPDLQSAKREYESFWSETRTLEFDDVGWKLSWRDGEDFRPWSRLRQLIDLKTLLVLHTSATPYWISKDALRRSGRLEALQNLAESHLTSDAALLEVPIKSPAWLYMAVGVWEAWRRKIASRILLCIFFMLIFYWAVFSDATSARTLWPILFVPVFLFLWDALNHLLQYFRTDWSAASVRATIMEKFIGFKSESTRWIVEYSWVRELRDIPFAFLLYFDAKTYYIFPKSGFSREQLIRFRELIAAKG